MTDDIILVNESGTTKMQAFTNTVGANSVKSEGITRVGSDGVPLGTTTNPEFTQVEAPNLNTDTTNPGLQKINSGKDVNLNWYLLGGIAGTDYIQRTISGLPRQLQPDVIPDGNSAPGPGLGNRLLTTGNLIVQDAIGNPQIPVASSAAGIIAQLQGQLGIGSLVTYSAIYAQDDSSVALLPLRTRRDNNAISSNTEKLMTLPARANAAAQVWTEGRVEPLSVDLAGLLRSRTDSWIGSAAPTVGQKAMASSLPVAISSDQSAVPIGNPSNLDVALSTRLADAKFPSTAALADATTNPTLTAVQDYQMLFNGSTWDRMKSSGVTGMAGIGGDTASAVSDAGNPVKIGGVANTGLPTAVTTGQRVNLLTDVYGRPRVVDERPKLLGMYYAESGNITVLATAHTSLQGFMWLSNTSATVKIYIRSIGFVWSGTAATAFPTSPRITVERVTFTGAPSGAAITPAKRDSTDAANTATLNTASTGLTLTAGAVIESFVVGSVLTAVGAVSVPEEIWQPKDDDGLIVLRQNEGIVIRQPDNGTAADTRKIVMTLSWEER